MRSVGTAGCSGLGASGALRWGLNRFFARSTNSWFSKSFLVWIVAAFGRFFLLVFCGVFLLIEVRKLVAVQRRVTKMNPESRQIDYRYEYLNPTETIEPEQDPCPTIMAEDEAKDRTNEEEDDQDPTLDATGQANAVMEEPLDIDTDPAEDGQAWMMQDDTIDDEQEEYIDQENDPEYYHEHPAIKEPTEPETHYVARGPAYRSRTGPIQLSPNADVTVTDAPGTTEIEHFVLRTRPPRRARIQQTTRQPATQSTQAGPSQRFARSPTPEPEPVPTDTGSSAPTPTVQQEQPPAPVEDTASIEAEQQPAQDHGDATARTQSPPITPTVVIDNTRSRRPTLSTHSNVIGIISITGGSAVGIASLWAILG
eukprot:g55280.t1